MLRWEYRFWKRGELEDDDIIMSNVSNEGNLVVGVRKGINASLTLLSGKGDAIWKKKLSANSSQLSENGESIVIEHDKHITAYNKRGTVVWDYKTPELIKAWSLSRDGSYVVVSVFIIYNRQYLPPYELMLLRHGVTEWERPVMTKRSTELLSSSPLISSNNEYIALVGYVHEEGLFTTKNYALVELYSLDGDLLWSLRIDGSPDCFSVTDDGEVLCLLHHKDYNKTVLIKDGKIIWIKEFPKLHSASSIPNGNRFVISNDESIFVLDDAGKIIWVHEEKRKPLTNCCVADNCYILANSSSHIVFLSPEVEVLRRKKINKISHTRISPNGRYFAVVTKDGNAYFFENQYSLIMEKKRKLVREIDELIKR